MDVTELFANVEAPYGLALHVALMGALAMVLVFAATWGDRSRRTSLGLGRAAFWPAIGWGMVALIFCYIASTASLLCYVVAADLHDPGGSAVLPIFDAPVVAVAAP